ncbi:hypothetical protein PILCRDRAFT_814769, partial [Piloderma croceum F 1598]
MNLSLSRDDPRNTVLVNPDGLPMYHIDTPTKWFGSGNTRIMNVSASSVDVGMIEWHLWDDTVLLVGRRRVAPTSSGMFSHSQVFQAGDGRKYKWKINGGYPLLVTDDRSQTPVENGIFSTPRPAFLSITPHGMHILDDIVTTFVWFEDKRRRRKRARRNGAIAAAA